MKSLLDLRKDETRIQENEMELQLQLLMTEQKAWPSRPRFAPLCEFGGGLFIPAAKNAGGVCKDHAPALNRQGHSCRTCQFAVRPETKIGDRRQMPTGAGGSQETAFYRQLNKEQDDADAMAQALEIEQSFMGDGSLPSAYFLPTCSVRLTEGRRNVVPFCNIRNVCREHRAHFPLPKSLVGSVEQTAREADAGARNDTIKLAQLVAKSDIRQPSEFLADLTAWVREDDARRWSAAVWGATCLYGRWAAELSAMALPNDPKAGTVATLPSYRSGDPVPAEWGAAPTEPPPLLLPVIAGCDAYEWGRLAAFSRTSDENAKSAGAVLCQQAAEFLATIVSPFEAAACIDAIVALLDAKTNLFASRTIEVVEGFVKRLRCDAEAARIVAQTDLQQHLEGFAGAMSYKVGAWSVRQWRDPSMLAQLDAAAPMAGERLRQEDRSKLAEARLTGATLLESVAAVAAGALSPDERINQLGELIAANEGALDRDRMDSEDRVNEAFNESWERLGLPGDLLDSPVGDGRLTPRSLLTNAIRRTFRTLYDVPRATENPRRKVVATLFFRRGLDSFTPTALKETGRAPQPGRIPVSIEQALSEPMATTVEALHKAHFGSPEVAQRYLTSIRRIGSPRLVPPPSQPRHGIEERRN
jgi:hypothetical protein